jgi:hypothetical protein
LQIAGGVFSAFGHGGGERSLFRGFAARLRVRRLSRRSSPPGRLFGCVLSGLGHGGANLSPGLLGRLPSSLLDRGSNLPSRFLSHVPPSLLARLRDGGGNLSREFLLGLPTGILDSRCRLPRLFLRNGGGNLSRQLLLRLPTSLLYSSGRFPRLPLGNLASHLLRSRARLQPCVLRCFSLFLGSLLGGLTDGLLSGCSSRLLTQARLPVALFDGLPASLGLLRVHIAMDQPLAVFSQRHVRLASSPPPSCHRKKLPRRGA